MEPSDAHRVLEIYQAGLDGANASFETVAPTWERFDAAHLDAHRLVAEEAMSGRVVGWAAVTRISDRCVYAGVVEHSVYVDPDRHGQGVGRALMEALIASTEEAGVWTIQSGIFPENVASLTLHARVGFRVVGTRERIGKHNGRWRDVVMVERRSERVG